MELKDLLNLKEVTKLAAETGKEPKITLWSALKVFFAVKGYVENTLKASDITSDPFETVTATNIQAALEEIFGDMLIESGFKDRAESTLTFSDSTPDRTMTITPVGDDFSFWCQSQKYVKSAADTYQIPNLEGLHYIYYDQTGTLTSTQSFTPSIITDFTFVCFVYWDLTNSKHILFGDERHGRTMDSATHSYLHNVFSTQYDSGLDIGNMDVDGSGNDASAAQLSISNGVIRDEDIRIEITDGSPQDLSPILNAPIYHRDGLDASGIWRKIDATAFVCSTTGSGRGAYNQNNGGTWQLTEVGNNNYFLMHLYATNDIDEPMIWIMGEAEYGTVTLAREGATTEILSLQFGPLDEALPEYLPVATIILETRTSYTNAVKSRVRSTDTGDDYIDWRGATIVQSGGTSIGALLAANNLSDLLDAATARTNLAVPRMNTSTSAPGVNDDTTAGYAVGSQWYRTGTNIILYVCSDASAGAAVWNIVTCHTVQALTWSATINFDVINGLSARVTGTAATATINFTPLASLKPGYSGVISLEGVDAEVITIQLAGSATNVECMGSTDNTFTMSDLVSTTVDTLAWHYDGTKLFVTHQLNEG